MTNAIVLGAGMVGSVIAADLSTDPAFRVTVADSRDEALERARTLAPRPIQTLKADLSDPALIRKTVAPFDIVLGALSSRIGFQTLRAVIESGKHYCDISFMGEDALQLDTLAKKHNVTALVDFGVAPGMSNLLAGHAAALLNPCEDIAIYVGGLPRLRTWPFDYKAAFAPSDVIEEYTRPSRIVEHGTTVVRPALSEPELLDLPGVGTVEAFNTDGLRSLASTLRVPSMKEKTLRYPGHIELMRAFRETGLFSHEPVTLKDADTGAPVRVRPIDLTSTLLFPKWTYTPGEQDLTVMRVEAVGTLDGSRVRLSWDLLDFLDPATGFTSMARTTAFPCAIGARLIASGRISARGVIAPELLGHDTPLVQTILAELERRGVRYATARRTP
jgi:saccharopine dehydrogenase-like NADP-dependent oxidoreductase